MKVLLLEDNAADAGLTRKALTDHFPDCTIELAGTLKQAGPYLKEDPLPDIALLDMQLPDGSGMDLLMEIRQSGSNMAVVMITGSGDEEVAVAALKAGANDYLVKKPGYQSGLPLVIEHALNNQRNSQQQKAEIIQLLYIEHNYTDLDLTMRHLKRYAPYIQIDFAVTAEDALIHLPENKTTREKCKYDIILLDYRLAGMNALDFIKTIRQERRLEIPIILVTGQGSEEVATQALKLGANDYLTKRENYLFRLPSLITSVHEHAELKRKQQALAESESKYRLLAENSGDVIFVLDRNLKYSYISPAVKALRGFEPEEAMNQDIRDSMTPESYERASKILIEYFTEEIVNAGIPAQQSIELELIRKDKTTVWAEIKASVYFDETNRPVGIIGVSRDISERRKAEEEQRKLSRAVEQSPVSIMITNTQGIIEYVNPRFCEITGYSIEEARGMRPSLLKSGFTTEQEYKKLWDIISSGNEWHGEFKNKRKDGSLFWEHASISAIKNSRDQITHFLGVKEDITQKKKFEQDLIRAKEKAEESDRLKTAFLQNISHEIRTPLNAIVGFSTLMGDDNMSPEKRREFGEIIQTSNDQLLSVISGIISLATLEAGQEQCTETEANINEILKSIYDQFNISAFPGQVDFHYQTALPDHMAIILTDPVKLTQILLNLVSNALKFTHKGHVKFGYELANKVLKFYVEDTGIGIPADMQEVIFERFRQVDNSPTRRYGGAGLGLALSKGYAELLGGSIVLTSEPGKGSLFSLILPYKPAGQKTPPVVEAEDAKAIEIPQGKVVMVVEDEVNNYMLLNEMLTDLNLHVKYARNGLEAVTLCDGDELPDLILMDIKMPVMDGMEARKIIKENHPQLKIVAITAYALETDRDQFLEMGFDGYLEKPMKKDALAKTLYRLLENQA